MKKFTFGILVAVSALVLVACGGTSSSDDKIIVGASYTPHSIILEQAKPLLKEKGIELVIKSYPDYNFLNPDLESDEIDANFFQHIPYFEAQIADHGYKFTNAGAIHIEPIGLYSKKYKSIEELPEEAVILMSNSVADHGRVLAMLESKGLIKLADGIDKVKAEVKDIVDNPKNLKFDANYDAALMPQLYKNDEGDALLINSNYAIDAGLNPIEDSIAIEDTDSPYTNIIAVREGDENNKAVKALMEVMKSKEIQDFILEEWGGSVVPVK